MPPSVEIAVRVGCYAVVFATMALWEWFAPRRHLTVGRRPRWPGNLGILAIDIIAVRLLMPTGAVGVALIAAAHGWGLLHLLALSGWAAIPVDVVALDLVIYTQHVVFHHVPVLWRLHRMHHTDLDLDVTTGVRFHPLNATSMFNHSNVVLPPRLESIVPWIVVTPQMHQVHHSIERAETDSNFGFNLPWWDRLFGTYRAKSAAGEERMTIGLPIFRDVARSCVC